MRTRFGLFCLGIMLLVLAGCNLPQAPVTPPTETIPEQTEEIAVPTEIPTPLPPQEKIAFIPSDDVPGITANITQALTFVCGDSYDCRTISSEDQIESDTDYVIFAQAPTAMSALTERFPQTHFILVSSPKTTYENAWTIQYDEAFLPFLAGLATASSARDWRSVGLLPNDSSLWGSHAEEAFENGAHYLCGNCRSILAPYVEFPLVISLPGNSAPESWISRYDEAQNSIIYTVFLSDEAMSQELLQKLVSLNVQMLGVSAPPAGLESNWLATVYLDWGETLRQIIARSEAGEPQGSMGVVLSIIPGRLSESFSDGKSGLLRQAYSELLSGKLSAYTPTTTYSE